MFWLEERRVHRIGIEPQVGDCFLSARGIVAFPRCQARKSGSRDTGRVDFKEAAQVFAIFAASEAVGAESGQAGNPGCDLIGNDLHVIGGGNDRHVEMADGLHDIGFALGLAGMQAVPAIDDEGIAAQFGVAGDAPHVGTDLVIVGENFLRLERFVENGSTAEECHV